MTAAITLPDAAPIDFVPSADTTRELRNAFGKFATGVTLVTCRFDGKPVGIAANSFSSVSLEPALCLWVLGKTSSRYQAFTEADHYAVHILSADQQALCGEIAKNGWALAEHAAAMSEHGVPLLDGALARLECRRSALHEGGDHTIIVGEILRASYTDGEALTYFASQYGRMG